MKKAVLFLFLVVLYCNVINADVRPIVIHNGGGGHDYMFSLWLNIPYGTINFVVTFDLTLASSMDSRDILGLNNHSVRNLHIHAGYKRGDVSGNGILNISDVIMAQDIVLNSGVGANPYELDAADVDGDGVVTISDISDLIELIVS